MLGSIGRKFDCETNVKNRTFLSCLVQKLQHIEVLKIASQSECRKTKVSLSTLLTLFDTGFNRYLLIRWTSINDIAETTRPKIISFSNVFRIIQLQHFEIIDGFQDSHVVLHWGISSSRPSMAIPDGNGKNVEGIGQLNLLFGLHVHCITKLWYKFGTHTGTMEPW